MWRRSMSDAKWCGRKRFDNGRVLHVAIGTKHTPCFVRWIGTRSSRPAPEVTGCTRIDIGVVIYIVDTTIQVLLPVIVCEGNRIVTIQIAFMNFDRRGEWANFNPRALVAHDRIAT